MRILKPLASKLLTFASLVGLDRQLRRARFAIKAEHITQRGGEVKSRKFRRSRCYRGKQSFPGRSQSSPLRQVRNFTALSRGMAGLWPETIDALRAQNKAKQDRKKNWKDPRFQNTNAALAMAA